MAIKITEKKENPLLSRKELKGELDYSAATPSNEAVAKDIAAAEKADVKLVKVKQIINVYGERKADVTAYIYDNAEALKKAEEINKKKQKKGAKPAEGEEEAPAEAPKEEKKEEAPAEEAPKEEEKKE